MAQCTPMANAFEPFNVCRNEPTLRRIADAGREGTARRPSWLVVEVYCWARQVIIKGIIPTCFATRWGWGLGITTPPSGYVCLKSIFFPIHFVPSRSRRARSSLPDGDPFIYFLKLLFFYLPTCMWCEGVKKQKQFYPCTVPNDKKKKKQTDKTTPTPFKAT